MASYKARVEKFLRDNNISDKATIVFRIEDSEGQGPYQKTYILDSGDPYGYGNGKNEWHRPTPWKDGLDYDNDHNFCFDSFEQMHRWFNRAQREGLRAVGCNVSVYRVRSKKHLQRSRSQMLFKKQYADKVGTLVI